MNKELNLAFNILNNVYFNGAYASIELNKNFSDSINFNLVTKIVYGVMDQDVKLEYFISQFVKKQPKKQVKLILKIGTYIKLELNSIPNFAYVFELVEIAKHSKLKPYVSFINATLKKISVSNFVYPNKFDKFKYYSVTYSKPIWFVKLLFENFDESFVENYLSYNLSTKTHVRINTQKTTISNFLSTLQTLKIDFTPSVFTDAIWVDYSKLVREKSLNGCYTPQGIPSMIVSKNCGGKNILDSCSAPGGKAVYVATLNPKSSVIACDVYAHRVKLIEEYASNMGVKNIKTMEHDATLFNPEFENKFDCVILDVPCSGLGVINKKPDILINNELKFDSLPTLQLQILNNNAKYVKKGGFIIYSTCTILPQENEDVVNKFLKLNKNFKIEPVNTFNVNALDNFGLKTFYPHISQTEGFFIGKLVRYE